MATDFLKTITMAIILLTSSNMLLVSSSPLDVGRSCIGKWSLYCPKKCDIYCPRYCESKGFGHPLCISTGVKSSALHCQTEGFLWSCRCCKYESQLNDQTSNTLRLMSDQED